MEKNFTFTSILFLLIAIKSFGADSYSTIAPGNWQSASTWLGGQIPNPQNMQFHNIIINHDVTIDNMNIVLLLHADLIINNSKLIINNGNLVIQHGNLKINNSSLIINGQKNLELTTCNARMEANNSLIQIGNNFINNQGFRIFNYVCLNVNQIYLNNNGIDSLINTEATIGLNTNISFENNAGLIYASGSNIHLTTGNLHNHSGALFNGSLNSLWIENGNLLNNAVWWSNINNYCISGTANISQNYLPSTQNCANISSFFNSPLCCPASGTSDCIISGPDVVCPGSNQTYTAGNITGNYNWQISGNASIQGSTGNSQAVVLTSNNCNTSFTLTLSVTGSCAFTCTKTVIVADTTLPHCDCPPVTSVPCGSTITFTQPNITDDCDNNLNINVYSNYIIPQPDGNNFHVQVWQATDNCGNTILSSQGIIELCGSGNKNATIEPNPFSDYTILRYIPPVTGYYTIEILGLNGKIISSLYSATAIAGQPFELKFHSEDLPPGIYFYRIKGDDNNFENGKLILTR